MKTVLLRGPFTISAGYGVHARQIAKWFFDNKKSLDLDVKFELTPWGDCYSIVDTEACDGLIGWIYQNMKEVENASYDLSVQVQLPNEWNPTLAKVNVGITAGIETTLCNPNWIPAINSMSKVIVPSEFTKSIFVETARQIGMNLTTPVEVIPESFDGAFESDVVDTTLMSKIDLTADFNFLLFGQLTGNNPYNDRKNIPFAIKWFIEEFKGDKNVGLVLKTGFARGQHMDRRMTAASLQQYLIDLKYDSLNDPRITILHGNLDQNEIASLFAQPKIKAFYCPTRAEGFNIPALNAAAAGMPVMATNWSAHTEFLNKGKWIKFDYELENVHESKVDNNLFFKEARWSMPSEKDVKAKLRKIYTDYSRPLQWAKELKIKIKQEYSAENVGTYYTKFFNSILTA
jgi:glycosyltransferase involved in cell wall biosynthesis